MKIGASFSTGRVAYAHDLRITHTNNVDTELSKDNVTLVDNLQGKSIEEYTNERMQPVIDQYNAKQRRKDRKINVPYCDYFNNQKDHGQLAYEAVLQYGEHDDLGKRYYEATTPEEKAKIRQQYVNVYRYMLNVMKEKYPHLEILYATIHFDEPLGTPHMHICYQGIGKNYKQGLSEQVSIGNALSCCGVERVKSRAEAQELGGYQLTRFYHDIRHKYFIPLLQNRLKYEIKEEQHGVKHDEPDIYKAKQEAKQAVQERDEAIQQRDEVIQELQGLTQQKEASKAQLTAYNKKNAEIEAVIGEKQQLVARYNGEALRKKKREIKSPEAYTEANNLAEQELQQFTKGLFKKQPSKEELEMYISGWARNKISDKVAEELMEIIEALQEENDTLNRQLEAHKQEYRHTAQEREQIKSNHQRLQTDLHNEDRKIHERAVEMAKNMAYTAEPVLEYLKTHTSENEPNRTLYQDIQQKIKAEQEMKKLAERKVARSVNRGFSR